MLLLLVNWLFRSVTLTIAAAFLVTAVEAQDLYPVTITHALGKTIVNQPPERIVTLGWSSEDAVLALGKIPVGMPHYRFFESGIFPWNEERLGATRPYLFEGDIDYEAIAALRPDLILGIYSGIDDLAYKRLSSIAPTVAYRTAPWSADWKEDPVSVWSTSALSVLSIPYGFPRFLPRLADAAERAGKELMSHDHEHDHEPYREDYFFVR